MRTILVIACALLLAGALAAQVDSSAKYATFSAQARDYNQLYRQVQNFCTQRGGGNDTIRMVFFSPTHTCALTVPSIANATRAYIKNYYLDSLKAWRKRANDSAAIYLNGAK